MNRTEVIQKILDKKRARSYLEIGVDFGDNFFPIKARKKIAVDPTFKFSAGTRLKWTLKNYHNLFAQFHELSSDSYFANANAAPRIDVAFVDGLHTYRQSLKDVNNVLNHLNENGVIVMHDCNPPNSAAAYPAESLEHAGSLNLPGWSNEWCGDVWKTICNLRSNRKDLRIFVLDCDYGLGIITRGNADTGLDFSDQMIDEMTYDALSPDKDSILNLKGESFLYEFLKTI